MKLLKFKSKFINSFYNLNLSGGYIMYPVPMEHENLHRTLVILMLSTHLFKMDIIFKISLLNPRGR